MSTERANAALRRLVVVDDNPLYLRSVRRRFSRASPKLELALLSDAVTALDYLAHHDTDMVMFDVFMPGMDGLEACRRLREITAAGMIVLASADMTAELRQASLEAGASVALDKPFDLDPLLEARAAIRAPIAMRARMVAAHLELALNVAAPLARRYGSLLGAAEVASLAQLGLCEAAARFDPDRPEPFIAFAVRRIRGAVLDEVRKQSTGGTPTAVATLLDDITPAKAIEQAEILLELAQAKASLPPLELAVIEWRYRDDHPLRTIAARLGLTQAEVQRLHVRALAKLRKAMQSRRD